MTDQNREHAALQGIDEGQRGLKGSLPDAVPHANLANVPSDGVAPPGTPGEPASPTPSGTSGG
jgi:hypothetical protein